MFSDRSEGHAWWEGTAHQSIALRLLGKDSEADSLLTAIRTVEKKHPPLRNGRGIVAVCSDGVPTGIDGFDLYARMHIAATAWYVMASEAYNPFVGMKLGR
jgi:hypothetical protein